MAARMLAVVNHVDKVPAGGSRALRPRLYEGLSTAHCLVVNSYPGKIPNCSQSRIPSARFTPNAISS